MNFQVPEYIRTLAPYVPGKPIEETQREFKLKHVVKLASNENPLGPSPKGVLAVRKAMKDMHRYPDASAYRLKNAIAQKEGLEPSQVLVGNGSEEVISLLIRTYTIPGDKIACPQASFIAYPICAQAHGVSTVRSGLLPGMRADLDDLLRVVKQDERVRMVFLANPNNPTGTYVPDFALRAFLKECAKVRGGTVLVVLDYAYWEYVTAKDLSDPLEMLRLFPNVVVTRTFSKIYGLAGLRTGYGLARSEIWEPILRIKMPFNLTIPALVAAEAALNDRGFVSRARKVNEQGMKFWMKALDRLEIPFFPSQGNFLLCDVKQGLGLSGPEVYQACLRKGVIFRPVANYGLPDHLRISIGTPEENRVGLKALASVGRTA